MRSAFIFFIAVHRLLEDHLPQGGSGGFGYLEEIEYEEAFLT
jgi:hypothetical protein